MMNCILSSQELVTGCFYIKLLHCNVKTRPTAETVELLPSTQLSGSKRQCRCPAYDISRLGICLSWFKRVPEITWPWTSLSLFCRGAMTSRPDRPDRMWTTSLKIAVLSRGPTSLPTSQTVMVSPFQTNTVQIRWCK